MRLAPVLDALIIETDGFGVFNNKEKQRFIRKLAEEKGILILTDGDAAGFRIRAFLGSLTAGAKVYHAYIPDVYGKEKRKDRPSAEGKLGVEAIDTQLLKEVIERSGALVEESADPPAQEITVADLYADGFSGRENSAGRRRALLRYFGLPERLSTSSFIKVINMYIGPGAYLEAVDKVKNEK
ncbi:MAG: DUF4093 domain-containing protein [Clostridia bacterium]|nr:DUF4093 domain-containing protein [Clostridia bacterium]